MEKLAAIISWMPRPLKEPLVLLSQFLLLSCKKICIITKRTEIYQYIKIYKAYRLTSNLGALGSHTQGAPTVANDLRLQTILLGSGPFLSQRTHSGQKEKCPIIVCV